VSNDIRSSGRGDVLAFFVLNPTRIPCRERFVCGLDLMIHVEPGGFNGAFPLRFFLRLNIAVKSKFGVANRKVVFLRQDFIPG